jgi:hypothetical protein
MECTLFFFEFFANPIVRVSQLLSRYEIDEDSSTDYWPGEVPVLVFTIEGGNGERSIAVAGRDYELRWRELDTTYDVVAQAERFVSEELERDQKFIGIASLDSAMSPVPGWSELKANSVTIIEKNQELLGFSLLLNLGTRVGVFVAPNPGVTLTFNEQCDTVIEQARIHHDAGRLKTLTRTYEGKQTPKQFTEIDWFDWLK